MRELGVRFATSLDLVDRGPTAVVNELVPMCDAINVSMTSMYLTSASCRVRRCRSPVV
jgi:hypothetical protein